MNKVWQWVLVSTIVSLSLTQLGAAQAPPWRESLEPVRETTEIVVGESEITVELSVSTEQQTLGLGYRNGLADGRGMLFVNETAAERSFWMKGMRFCIDIIWIEDGAITGAAEFVCPDPLGTDDGDRPRYPSGEAVTYVLEVPAGWLEANGYGTGTSVEIPEQVQD
jgi:uncharacterized membrane protein (UPF0127 family)